MIRVRTAQTPEKLEALLNEQEADGFTLKTLAFRGFEAVGVFEMTGATIELTGQSEIHTDHPSAWQPLKVDTEKPSKPAPDRQPQNSFKRRGR